MISTATVTFLDANARVYAEVSRNVALGLMGRMLLPENAGMLFDMKTDEDHGFYMKGVLIPLDMIFIDRVLSVVGIIPNAQPGDETLRHIDKPSRYVVEVNGGWCKRHGVTVGQKVAFA